MEQETQPQGGQGGRESVSPPLALSPVSCQGDHAWTPLYLWITSLASLLTFVAVFKTFYSKCLCDAVTFPFIPLDAAPQPPQQPTFVVLCPSMDKADRISGECSRFSRMQWRSECLPGLFDVKVTVLNSYSFRSTQHVSASFCQVAFLSLFSFIFIFFK